MPHRPRLVRLVVEDASGCGDKRRWNDLFDEHYSPTNFITNRSTYVEAQIDLLKVGNGKRRNDAEEFSSFKVKCDDADEGFTLEEIELGAERKEPRKDYRVYLVIEDDKIAPVGREKGKGHRLSIGGEAAHVMGN